ncbi:MAG: family 20 glycosylhydrolase [Armatimonadota bacterium]
METFELQNDLWDVEVSPIKGRVTKLTDRTSGAARVIKPSLAEDYVAEGGHEPFFGLEPWTKCGDIPDFNTGVLSTFAAIHGKPFEIEKTDDSVCLRARADGLALEITWTLPSGATPLACRLMLTNESAPADDFQFECFFGWHVPAAAWTQTAVLVPGLPAAQLNPFGEIRYEAGGQVEPCAAWWTRGTSEGVALRAAEGIEQFFSGIHGQMFILGPHSVPKRLAPGESLTAAFEIAPLAFAQAQGWSIDIAAAERALDAERAQAEAFVSGSVSLREWATPATPSPIANRALHLTLQYGPSDLRGTIALLENIAAPLGYTQLMVEVDRAFPYRSHPTVAPAWAWSRAQWAEFIAAARGLGFELIPQYNALAHMGESGLTAAYPELREDREGWCLCPQHPKTLPTLCDLFDELIDAFTPKITHIGLDEVDVPSRPQTFCVCPKCKGADGGEIFADHILGLHAHLVKQGQEVMMWPDMLLYRPEHNTVNGLRTGMWRAIDRLPRDIIMIDWVYSPVQAYGGTEYLREKGFRVMGATWHDPRAIAEFSRYAAQMGLYGMCQTLWAGPTLQELPAACLFLGGKYFAEPMLTDHARVLAEAKAFAAAMTGELSGSIK